MLVADTYLGHRDDPNVADHLADTGPDSDVHRVVLSDIERRRSRVRTQTTDGHDLGVVIGRDLADGDVLEASNDDPGTGRGDFVIVELVPVEAMVVNVTGNDIDAPTALELGHALGNRHLDLAVRNGNALTPVSESRETLEALVLDVVPDASIEYVDVPPTTFDDDGHTPDHRHSDDHSNDHDHTNDHEHHHASDHSHSHEPTSIRSPRTIDDGEES